jgi:hypothetical protein
MTVSERLQIKTVLKRSGTAIKRSETVRIIHTIYDKQSETFTFDHVHASKTKEWMHL